MTKPLLKLVGQNSTSAFKILKVKEPYFFPSFHFHPECEIMLVQEGSGIRYTGDSMANFQADDLVLYGPNLPHFYRCDEAYYHSTSTLVSKATVIYFKEDFLGHDFLNLSDVMPIKKMLSRARSGIRFYGNVNIDLKRKILDLDEDADGMENIISLLSILRTMALTEEYEVLSGSSEFAIPEDHDCERINRVNQYIMNHYSNSPSLSSVAKIANMSEAAFCRYFKAHTQKTYTQFLNEIKIGNACKLLMNKNLSVSQVCFEIGFNNFNHFNNQFKRITGLTPKQFQYRQLTTGSVMAS